MTKEVSALFDGELDEHEDPAAWRALKSETSLRQTWGDYQLIGDALRRERRLDADITARVMSELKNEPIVLAPRTKPAAPAWRRTAIAMAASVAGIAVVGWLAVVQPTSREGAQLARNEPPPIQVAATAVPPKGIEEYVLAHQANAHSLPMQGGTQHIRTVSAMGGR